MATKVVTKKGKIFTLLNPAEKGRKYAAEMRENVRATNDHAFKRDKDGNKIPLTKAQRAFRAGYLNARKDNAKVYKFLKEKSEAASIVQEIVPELIVKAATVKKPKSRKKKNEIIISYE